MSSSVPANEYSALINSIRRKRKIIGVLMVIAIVIVALISSPGTIYVPGKATIEYSGISPGLTVIFIILILFCALIAYSVVLLPLTSSLQTECDPQKHLALNTALNSSKHPEQILVADYLYLGDFEAALKCADISVVSGKPLIMLNGLYNKARCEFFLGNREAMKQTVSDYEVLLSTSQKLSPKKKATFEKVGKALRLSLAILEGDKEKISELHVLDVWADTKLIHGYVNYLEGVAAYYLEDKNEVVYRMMRVKEDCSKTVLARMADDYLSRVA